MENTRGLKSQLAKAIRAPLSHISQVLSGKSHLTLEQTESANSFFEHNDDECEYFLILVQFTRAGTPQLKKRLEQQLNKIRDKRLVIQNRIEVKESISLQDQACFYSKWFYQAIHILATIPAFQTKQAIAQRLNISLKTVTDVLDFLQVIGLIRQTQEKFQASVSRIHLGADSPLISKHHLNWRLKTLEVLERENNGDDLHYSSVISISISDFKKIKEELISNITSIKEIVRDSNEEELYCFSADLFRV